MWFQYVNVISALQLPFYLELGSSTIQNVNKMYICTVKIKVYIQPFLCMSGILRMMVIVSINDMDIYKLELPQCLGCIF